MCELAAGHECRRSSLLHPAAAAGELDILALLGGEAGGAGSIVVGDDVGARVVLQASPVAGTPTAAARRLPGSRRQVLADEVGAVRHRVDSGTARGWGSCRGYRSTGGDGWEGVLRAEVAVRGVDEDLHHLRAVLRLAELGDQVGPRELLIGHDLTRTTTDTDHVGLGHGRRKAWCVQDVADEGLLWGALQSGWWFRRGRHSGGGSRCWTARHEADDDNQQNERADAAHDERPSPALRRHRSRRRGRNRPSLLRHPGELERGRFSAVPGRRLVGLPRRPWRVRHRRPPGALRVEAARSSGLFGPPLRPQPAPPQEVPDLAVAPLRKYPLLMIVGARRRRTKRVSTDPRLPTSVCRMPQPYIRAAPLDHDA